MKILLTFLAATIVALFLLSAHFAYAEPTPKASKLIWDNYTDPDATGFFLYWVKQSEPAPRVYSNLRRIDVLRPEPEQVVIIQVKPDALGGLCFKLTAYDAAGNESGFSNEACGYVGGIDDPVGLGLFP
jgi:hypothetical protein